MTQRIYKYPLGFGDWVTVNMPIGAEPLCAQSQGGMPQLWARVTVENEPTMYHFRIAGTGDDLGSNVGRHISTLQMSGGGLMLHVFAEAGK